MATKAIIFTLILTISILITKAQEKNVSKHDRRPLRIFVFTERDNQVIDDSVDAALKTIMEKTGELNYFTFNINATSGEELLHYIDHIWNENLEKNNAPDLILDITRSSTASEVIYAFTAVFSIPTFAVRFGEASDLDSFKTHRKKPFLVSIKPPADLVPYAVQKLASTMNISNAAIIFDNHFVMDHKYKDLLLNIPTRHVIVKAKNNKNNEIKDQMQQLRRLDIVNFFVLGEKETICNYLEIAGELNYVGRKYGWYAITLDHEFVPQCNCSNVTVLFFKPNLTNISLKQYHKLTKKGSIMTPLITSAFYYECAQLAFEAMKQAVNEGLWSLEPSYFNMTYLLSLNSVDIPQRNFDLLNILRNISSSSNFFLWTDYRTYSHQASFEMQIQMSTIINGQISKTTYVGEWKPSSHSRFYIPEENLDIVRNHTAVTSFRVVTVEVPPFVEYDPENDRWFGYSIDLLDKISNILFFEYEIYAAPDGKFGAMNESDGTWNGMIGELIKKKADIAIGTLSVMAERENVVDFTVPYYDLVGLSILMYKPVPPTSLFKFLTVLENEVWLCILGAYFFTSFLMWIFDRWSPYSYHNNEEKYKDDIEEKRIFDLKECLWFCMTSLTPQGGGDSPKNLSGRLVAAVWWLFGFIIIASYTANLAAFLTVSRLETPVESLDDLSNQYKIEYAPIYPSEAYTYFERMSAIEKRFYKIWKDMAIDSKEPEKFKYAVWDYPLSNKYTKMFEAMKVAGFPKSKEEALKRVRRQIPEKDKTEFAFIGDATEIKYLAMTTCDLLMVGDEFSRKPYAIAVQEGSPLKDQINNAILKLLNKRELETLKNKWWTDNPKRQKCSKEESQNDGISIQNIGGVFIVIFMGIILACITLAYEYWFYRYKPQQKEKKRLEMNKIHPKNNTSQNLTLKLRSRVKKNSELHQDTQNN
ncbi:ionotropic receptor 25a-like [Chelonus insularis]|uniref:ionotropic receptor 25a-like n=1 Tax=Chelonus insularis TaxID=460826 RepID=UPI00158D07B8|nr:ionotropic receptor 25a-like [Chelonus insularis]